VDKEKGGILEVKFVAADLNRVPSINPEKCDLQVLVKEILSLKEKISLQSGIISSISEKLATRPCSCATIHVADPGPTSTSQQTTNVRNKRQLSPSAKSFTPVFLKKQFLEDDRAPHSKRLSSQSATPGVIATTPTSRQETSVKKILSFASKVETLATDERSWTVAGALKKEKSNVHCW
jgi:hypothetical protein